MTMWIVILGIVLALAVASIIYLISRFKKFYIVERLAGDRKALRWLIACVPMLGFVVYGIFDLVNSIMAMLHLAIFWLIFDIVAAVVSSVKKNKAACLEAVGEDEKASAEKSAGKKASAGKTAESEAAEGAAKRQGKVYWLGVAVILTTFIYLAAGWFFAHHVYETNYELHTEKNLGTDKLRLALIADSHIGALFDGDGFAEHIETIQKAEPDVLLITGDYVDDSTKREDMVKSCAALGRLKTTYGVYYSCGNHDKGYYRGRDFSYEELKAELEKNGVTVLEDETVLLNDSFYIVGRQDKSEKDRASAGELTSGLDKSKYIIMMDHQPNDYDAEAAAEADLVLSGHTHGGQMLPMGFFGEKIFRANDRTYGKEVRGNTTFIVTSGIADWAIRFKTGTIAEYVVIDIYGK